MKDMDLSNIKEIELGCICEELLRKRVKEKTVTVFRAKKRPIVVSNDMLVKVNTNFGVSDISQKTDIISLIKELSALKYSPDIMMDLTNIEMKRPLWEDMLEFFGGPIGTLPHYPLYNTLKGIDRSALLENINELGEKGISFITIHPTVSREVQKIASRDRRIASTSRGGSIVYHDMIINNREVNVFEESYNDILSIAKKHDMVISIGTTYRPSNNEEALDEAHLKEIQVQRDFIDKAKSNGNEVIMEGIGHLELTKLIKYMSIIEEIGVTLMPLGPMLSDATIGFDHVTSSIGAAFASHYGSANIINSVTRDEHTGGIPSKEAIIEGLMSARVAARCINLSRVDELKNIEKLVSNRRQENKTCAVSGGLFQYSMTGEIESGCERCKHECPLELLSI